WVIIWCRSANPAPSTNPALLKIRENQYSDGPCQADRVATGGVLSHADARVCRGHFPTLSTAFSGGARATETSVAEDGQTVVAAIWTALRPSRGQLSSQCPPA